jgi:phosphate transport system permease protein/phosphate transport system substrate-binding protein
VRQFTERTVDFGASDAPLTGNETQALPAHAVHIPEMISSGATAYIHITFFSISGFIYKG